MLENKNTLLEFSNVSKVYPGVKALDDVSFSIKEGEVVALLGENGAGKSTLMKILSGAIDRDEGNITICSKSLPKKSSPLISRDFGIAIIYQELSLLSQLSVSENIYLTKEPIKNKIFIDYKTLHKNAKKQLEKLNAQYIDVRKKVEELSISEKQMVEIAKALAVDCRLIIMDEPTTSLTWEETFKLFDVINKLKENNITVIYISHRMDEIFKIADTAVVMRDGKFVGKVNVSDTTSDELVQMMTGKLIERKTQNKSSVNYEDSNVALHVNNVTDNKYVHDISFKLYRHEVLGISGLIGSKRTELARLIFGADKLKNGNLMRNNHKFFNKSPSDSIKNKIGYLSENRKEEGLNLGMSLKENIVLSSMNKISKYGAINYKKVDEIFDYYKKSINIKGNANGLVQNLSGGNQQKIVISKWLYAGCDILIFDEPTRGIDVAAKSEIYKLIRQFANEKEGCIVISSDAAEIVDICDRVLIMKSGKIVNEIRSENINQENILMNIVNAKC